MQKTTYNVSKKYLEGVTAFFNLNERETTQVLRPRQYTIYFVEPNKDYLTAIWYYCYRNRGY